MREAGRELTETADAVRDADIVVLAVPDLALGPVTADIVPQLKPGAIVLTLDPAAAYAGLLTDPRRRHPGRRAPVPPVDLPAAHHAGGVRRHVRRHRRPAGRDRRDRVRRPGEAGDRRGHRARDLRADHRRALGHRQAARPARAHPRRDDRLHDRRAPQGGARRGRQHDGRSRGGRAVDPATVTPRSRSPTACAATTRSATPASSPWTTASETIIKDDWKKIFRDDELDKNLAQMLHLDQIER